MNARNNNGETPLHWAAQEGHTEIARALITAGAKVNLADNYGRTPLNLAALHGHTETVEILRAAQNTPSAAAAAGGVEETKAEPAELSMEMTQEVDFLYETSDSKNQLRSWPRRTCTIM